MNSYFVHHSAQIDDSVSIGEGTKIWNWSHVSSGASIGKNCIIGQNVFIGKNVLIGDNVKIQNNVSIYEAVTIESDVFCGPSCVFTNVINPRSFIERKDEFKPTLVKKGATIGANSTIICGVSIGEYSLIGAAALVSKNVKSFALMIGVPAKHCGWVDIEGNKLKLPTASEIMMSAISNEHKYVLNNDKLFIEAV
jgi:UDP-2-acetamido-3-amino-2,3-dideoxy-glucuronate N-acetyltransferase